MSRKHFRLAAALLMVTTLAIAGLAGAQPATVTVFAAASTTNALTEIGQLFERQGQGRMLASFASSSTLAKQIENGAPAEIFLSANEKWMDYLERNNLVQPGSRVDYLGNRLVLVAPADSRLQAEIKPGFPLLEWLGQGRLSVGDPDHVPAGIYAKAALTKLGVWEPVEPRLARAADVRGALALVERGEAPLGIVYATDAAIAPQLQVAGVFPEDSHPAIVYPLALVGEKTSPTARAFYVFLRGPEAKAIFTRYGFAVR
jgi:molybdate transport system substrate-binding protein